MRENIYLKVIAEGKNKKLVIALSLGKIVMLGQQLQFGLFI